MARNRFVKVDIERQTRPLPMGGYGIPVLIAGDGSVPFKKYRSLVEVEEDFSTDTDAYAALKAMFDQRERNEVIGVVSFDGDFVEDEEFETLTSLLSKEDVTGDGYHITTSLLDDGSIEEIASWAIDKDVIFYATTDSIELAESLSSNEGEYENTFVFVHDKPEQYAAARAAALSSGNFFGKFWLKFKALAGLDIVGYSENEIARIHAANANTYIRVSGKPMVSDAKLAGGEYVDIIQTEHYIVAQVTDKVFGLLTNNKKIPYTDTGIDLIHGGLISVLEKASDESVGVLALDDGGKVTYSTSAPRRKDIDLTYVTNRVLPDVKFTAVPTGAIGEVIINGVLTFEL